MVAGFGSVIGVGSGEEAGMTRMRLMLPPGEYVFTAQQAAPSPWTLVIEDLPSPDAGFGDPTVTDIEAIDGA